MSEEVGFPTLQPKYTAQAAGADRAQRALILNTLLRGTNGPELDYAPLTPEQIQGLWQQHQAHVAHYQPKYHPDEALQFLMTHTTVLKVQQVAYPEIAHRIPQLHHARVAKVERLNGLNPNTAQVECTAWGDCLAEALDFLVDQILDPANTAIQLSPWVG